MADDLRPPAEVHPVLAHALRAAGEMGDLTSWRQRLQMLIPEIVVIMSEGSEEYRLASHMLEAKPILGEYIGFEFNERSTRCRVYYKADRSNRQKCCDECDKRGEGVEHLWSDRTDTPRGAAQQVQLKALRKGQRVRMYRYTESIGSERKVRNMLHIARVDADVQQSQTSGGSSPAPAGASGGTAQPPSPQQAAPAASAAPASPAVATPSAAGEATSKIPRPDVHEAYERLPGPKRVKAARWAKDHGINNMFDPDLTDDQAHTLLAHYELLAQGLTE